MSKQLAALYELESARAVNAVGRAVLAALGRPADFLRVTVRRVTADGHRVNVVAGVDPTAARIAHSFFVTADDAGNLTGSVPPIIRLYGPATAAAASPRPA
ncbi:MAG TPA: hypothetical protein VH092_05405 [Urbifossiella sp.]|jgi:hypothetical protein|nr:hypothetical protein [Urbifossiella sp.]